MSFTAPIPVQTSRVARDELPKVLRRFRLEGVSAAPMVFGSHRKPEAVVIPFELYSELLPLVEDILIAREARKRIAAGGSVPLSEIADKFGIDINSF